ncbi:amidase [Aeromicrobium sp. 636]|uniref:Amidase n=1 Tax=Aeromicrobium senzhongii TaxID=2663859 RepID=A0A8I0EUZ7_9ACTN|nr:amidase [Aeromicrobium sp. 636]MBC9225587.1 amidase [Aeromicrobium senzhongii]MCQ3997696.1 amidase [Aeromicrobium sp. 636]
MTRTHAFTDDVLADHDAVAVAQLISSGAISASEALEASLARIDRVDPTLNAIAHDDRARAAVRAEEPLAEGAPFAGVPSLIKNNTDFKGLPTQQGSAAVPATPADSHEEFTEQFLATGVNVVAATTLPAFGLTASTEFVDREPTRNPWDPRYSSGASSGGSAALVAAGAVPIAHGNDGGGSIRIPAAACGLVGLKTTRNRLASAKAMKDAPLDIVANGVMTRSVRDTAVFLAAAERYRPVPRLPRVGLVEGPAKRRLRVGLVTATLHGEQLDEDSTRELLRVADLVSSLGHEVVDMPIPVDPTFERHFVQYWRTLAFSLDYTGRFVVSRDFDRSKVDPFTRGLARAFLRNFWRTPGALVALKRSARQYSEVFADWDVVLSPTLGHTTPEIGWLDPGVEFEEAFARLRTYVAYTPLNNASGGPAISLPLGRTSQDLPLGLHFSADHGDERTLLELAFELEAASPFARIQD